MSFATEQELVSSAVQYLPLRRWLKAPKKAPLFQQTEVPGLFGIPDLVAAFATQSNRKQAVRSIAFEMKLSNWRRGLMQAFRYRSFAYEAVLVMDDTRSRSAVANLDKFKRANIGLVGLRPDGTFEIYAWPQREEPFSPQLQAVFQELVNGVSHPTD
jgi:hypothetical protein